VLASKQFVIDIAKMILNREIVSKKYFKHEACLWC